MNKYKKHKPNHQFGFEREKNTSNQWIEIRYSFCKYCHQPIKQLLIGFKKPSKWEAQEPCLPKLFYSGY